MVNYVCILYAAMAIYNPTQVLTQSLLILQLFMTHRERKKSFLESFSKVAQIVVNQVLTPPNIGEPSTSVLIENGICKEIHIY